MPMTKNTSHRTLTWATTGGGEGGSRVQTSTRCSGNSHISMCCLYPENRASITTSASPWFQKSMCLCRLLLLPMAAELTLCAEWRNGVSWKLLNATEHGPRDDPRNLQRNLHFEMTGNGSAMWQDTAIRWPRVIADARGSAVPVYPATCASLLVKETHRSAECLPERDTLLPTGEGRLLPLCRSSMDLLQGFDLSTELSTVLSTLSKSNLKQKRDARRDWEIHIYTNSWMCITCSFLLYVCTLIWVVFANKQTKTKREIQKNVHGLCGSFKNTEWQILGQAK